MALNNGLGRPRLVEKYKSLFDFFNNYVLPEKYKLMDFQKDECKKRKLMEKSEAKSKFQKAKVERAYEMQEYFRK